MAIFRGSGGSLEGITEADTVVTAISQGGTGATTASGARTNLGLGTAATTDASAYATAAQGAKADTATQPEDLGTAAAEDVGYFATAAQGALADSAVQPGDLATVATTGSYNDLTDKPTAGSGTVTSVAMSVPTGLSVSGSPITTSGTLAVTYSAGYAIPTTSKQTNWDTAYGWGNHASAGYLTSETYTGTVTSVAMSVPTGLSVSGSPITGSGTLAVTLASGYSIPTTSSQTNWDTAYGWGNHASAGYAADSAVVKLTGDQTIAGSKTFSSTIVGSVSGNAANVTGTVAIANGGTGQTTANAAFNALAPSQTSNSGKYLTTNGTSTSWATVDALPSQTGNSGKYLTTNGTAASWATLNTDANSTTKGLYEMSATISSNYSVSSGNNALSAGPITIADGVTVTVPTGSVWTIVQIMSARKITDAETQAILSSWSLHENSIVWNRTAKGGKSIGDAVGFSVKKSGHRSVFLTIDRKLKGFVYSRVVWLLHYGEWPSGEIDHIDCNPQNDKIENLRIATRFENCQNTRYGRTRKEFKGTFQDKRNSKWHCQVQAFGKVHGKYGFATQEEAFDARQKLAKELHGEFAR